MTPAGTLPAGVLFHFASQHADDKLAWSPRPVRRGQRRLETSTHRNENQTD